MWCKKILVAYDGSAPSHRALEVMREIAAQNPAVEVVLVHVMRLFSSGSAAAGMDTVMVDDAMAIREELEAIAADTGCSIVFLHHASKGAAMMGAGDQQQASRGSSVLVDNIRWQSYLSSMTSAEAEAWGVDDDQRRFFVRFGVSKANYGAPFADRWFRRHDGGVLKPAVLERQRKSKGVPRGEA